MIVKPEFPVVGRISGLITDPIGRPQLFKQCAMIAMAHCGIDFSNFDCDAQLNERVEWIKEKCKGQVGVRRNSFIFEIEEEAVHFYLVFGDK